MAVETVFSDEAKMRTYMLIILFGICAAFCMIATGLPQDEMVKSLKIEEHTYQAIADNEVIFTIQINNVGDIKVQDIAVEESLPLDMAYIVNSTSSSVAIDEPIIAGNAEGTILTWAIGDLTSDQSRTIQFRAAGSADRASEARAAAIGTALGVPLVTPSIKAQEDIGPLG